MLLGRSLLPVHAATFSISQEEPALPIAQPASSLGSSSSKNRLSAFFQQLLSGIGRWHFNVVIKEEIPSGCALGHTWAGGSGAAGEAGGAGAVRWQLLAGVPAENRWVTKTAQLVTN